jgi:hypothetical protein
MSIISKPPTNAKEQKEVTISARTVGARREGLPASSGLLFVAFFVLDPDIGGAGG